MVDFSNPYIPNPSSTADAAIKLQSYFDNLQRQQDMQSAGQLFATDPAAARNQLMAGGHYDQAAQTQNLLKSMQQQELEHRNDTWQLLGRSASLYGNDPDKWKQITDLIEAKTGQPLEPTLKDPRTGPSMMRGLAQTSEQNFNQEMTRRKLELEMFKEATQLERTEGDQKFVRRLLPSGQLTPEVAIPKGYEEASTGKDKATYEFPKVGGNPLTGEGASVLRANKYTGEVVQPKIKKEGGEEPSESLAPTPQAQPLSGAAMPPASSAIPVAAALPVPGTKGGEEEKPSGLNEDALKGLAPGVRNEILAMNEGSRPLPENPRSGSIERQMINKLYEYNPNFNWRDVNQAYRTRQGMLNLNAKRATEGISFNTATNHAAGVIDASDWLPSGSQLSTLPAAAWANFRNDPRMSALMSRINVLAGEAAKVIHGGQSVDTESHLRATMDPSRGKEALQASVAAVMQNMAEKSGETEAKWKQTMRGLKMPEEMFDTSIMTPEAKNRLAEMKKKLLVSKNPALPPEWTVQKQDLKSLSDEDILKALKGQ